MGATHKLKYYSPTLERSFDTLRELENAEQAARAPRVYVVSYRNVAPPPPSRREKEAVLGIAVAYTGLALLSHILTKKKKPFG